MLSHSKNSRTKKRSKSGKSRKMSSSRRNKAKKHTKMTSVYVKEYSMTVFCPSGYTFDEGILGNLFPNVSLDMKKVIKKGSVVGYDYELSTADKKSFASLRKTFKSLIHKD